ncbi:DoxX family protein [Actinoplanes sp. CA-142083]|uniref:DoxX family protein n=1 Tax=Actinoplanes sp. CA-142083 TaxID=3239903 RepID=UPI003D8BC19C
MKKDAAGLAGLLAASGTLHFLTPKPYDSIVPRSLPGSPRTWTYLSGAAELAVAAAVACPRTRKLGATAAAALFVAVFPANVKMAADWRHASPVKRAIAFGRLPLQVPLVLWARRVAR